MRAMMTAKRMKTGFAVAAIVLLASCGSPAKTPDFKAGDSVKHVERQLKKHNMSYSKDRSCDGAGRCTLKIKAFKQQVSSSGSGKRRIEYALAFDANGKLVVVSKTDVSTSP